MLLGSHSRGDEERVVRKLRMGGNGGEEAKAASLLKANGSFRRAIPLFRFPGLRSQMMIPETAKPNSLNNRLIIRAKKMMMVKNPAS